MSVEEAPDLRMGLEHIIETSIASAWTAFETMVEDLWEAAVNIHPSGLASLSGKQRSTIRGKDGSKDSPDKIEAMLAQYGSEKLISIKKSGDYGFALKNKRGTSVRFKYCF